MSVWYGHILERFKVPYHRRCANHWRAHCPAHQDEHESLSIWMGKHGDRVMIGCWAGCNKNDVLHAVGLTMKELFRPKQNAYGHDQAARPERKLVAEYDYLDENGELLYQSLRYEPKDFRQRRPCPRTGNWLWDLCGVRLVLYRTPEILRQTAKVVWLVEGEKAADTLARAGLLATCNVGGCGMGWRDEYGVQLRGRRVVLLPDNDAPGRQLMQKAAGSLLARGAAGIRYVDLPGRKEHDGADDALLNMGITEFMACVQATPEWRACW